MDRAHAAMSPGRKHVPHVHHLTRAPPGHRWDAFHPPVESGARSPKPSPKSPKTPRSDSFWGIWGTVSRLVSRDPSDGVPVPRRRWWRWGTCFGPNPTAFLGEGDQPSRRPPSKRTHDAISLGPEDVPQVHHLTSPPRGPSGDPLHYPSKGAAVSAESVPQIPQNGVTV